jgi:two-component system, LytTR family, response regulator
MTSPLLTLIVADDERPARRFLVGLLKEVPGVAVVGEAASGEEAIALIRSQRPALALLDLQMPEMGGLDVVRHIPPAQLPLVAFVTAFDDYAIEAFELNAVDYLLKPVQRERLQATLDRVRLRVRAGEPVEDRAARMADVSQAYERATRRQYAERIPLRLRDKVLIVPVRTICSIVADGELLHIRTVANDRYTISHRLHALETRLDPRKFLRLSRSALVNVDYIAQVNPMPGGTYIAVLANGEQLPVSRIQSRALRDSLLKL